MERNDLLTRSQDLLDNGLIELATVSSHQLATRPPARTER